MEDTPKKSQTDFDTILGKINETISRIDLDTKSIQVDPGSVCEEVEQERNIKDYGTNTEVTQRLDDTLTKLKNLRNSIRI